MKNNYTSNFLMRNIRTNLTFIAKWVRPSLVNQAIRDLLAHPLDYLTDFQLLPLNCGEELDLFICLFRVE